MERVPAIPGGAVFILGHFDGVHRGHMALLGEAKRMAASLPSPAPVAVWFLSGMDRGGCLTTDDEKLRIFRFLGADYAVTDDFPSVRSFDGETFFFTKLLSAHRPSGVVCGFNFTFGRGASSGAPDLCRMAEAAGISCSVVPAYREDGVTVSSTEIRRLVLEGDLRRAARLSGRPYFVTGTVMHGQALGRTLGFPTLNLRLPVGKVAPPRGVYASLTRYGENGIPRLSPGMSNLGSRPTVNGDPDDVTLETNLFSRPGDLYGSDVTVFLLDYLRPERQFSSVDELRAAIAADADAARDSAADLSMDDNDVYYL